jgi:hypothetical protein
MGRILVLLFGLSFLVSCNKSPQFETDYSKYLYQDSFIDLSRMMLEESDIFLSINQASIHDEVGIVLYDQKSSSFFHLDYKGNIVRSFGSQGRGPYEYQMFTKTYLSYSGDFYLYDASSSKIIKYSSEGMASEFYIDKRVIDMAVNKNGEILVYHLTIDDNYVLTLYSAKGEEIISAFSPQDQSLKIFLNRFRDGGLSYSSKEDAFFFLYPEEYKVYVLDNSLEIINTISLQSNSLFSKELLAFPQNLNPFEMSPSHLDYWVSFHHPSGLSLIGSEYILVKNYEMFDLNNWQVYYNLYTKSGEFVFEGLIFPDSVDVIDTDGNFIYLSRESGISRLKVYQE